MLGSCFLILGGCSSRCGYFAGWNLVCGIIDWCIFILPSRESDGALCFGRIRTRLGVDHFPSFPVDVLTSSHVNLLLVRSNQAEIIIVKRLIQGRNIETWVGVELLICDQSRRKNDAFTISATLPTKASKVRSHGQKDSKVRLNVASEKSVCMIPASVVIFKPFSLNTLMNFF